MHVKYLGLRVLGRNTELILQAKRARRSKRLYCIQINLQINIFDPKQNEFVCIVGAWK